MPAAVSSIHPAPRPLSGKLRGEEAPPRSGARAARWDLGLLGLALGLAGWATCRQFAVEWESNPQYSYGWTVPFLTAFLLMRRWRERPAPLPPAAGSRGWVLAWAAVAVLAALWTPSRLVQEANPDWRPWGWLMALETLGLVFGAILLLGGLRWARFFAFPLCFFLVAAPWPERLEAACIQSLMRAVATVAVEFLDLLGVPALQQGNLIEVGGGLIGVEEACSGIRSLQATLMAGLFLGEFYRVQGAARRGALLLAGAGLALATNLARTLFLVFISVRHGPESFALWHDRAGMATLCACLLGVWIVALWLSPREEGARDPSPSTPAGRGDASRHGTPALPVAAMAGLAGWMLGAELLNEVWYRSRGEHATGPAVTWRAQPPANADGLKTMEIPDLSRAMLRYTEGEASVWLRNASTARPAGTNPERWSLFFARWAPGRAAAASAKMHNPRNCLTAAGKTLRADLGVQPVRGADGLILPLHAYRFEAGGGRELHVFHCLWEDRPVASTTLSKATPAAGGGEDPDDLSAVGRLRAAWMGRRNLGQRVLEISVMGPPGSTEALAAVSRELPGMIRVP